MKFNLPQKVTSIDTATDGISPAQLLLAFFSAAEKAWGQAIRPNMDTIRCGVISKENRKGNGTDFFTEADTHSETIIRQTLADEFGAEKFRIFGEEENAYSGNLDAAITIRIDPIDGTEEFKFGKATWSIMIGAYAGRGADERQIASVTYHPEHYDQAVFFAEGAGVFIGNNRTGEVEEIVQLNAQDEIGDILTTCYKHTDLDKRGNIDGIIKNLELAGARIRSMSSADAKEALETGGKRAFVVDGGFSQVDFIDVPALVHLGYRIFSWDGSEFNFNDPALADKKVVLVPPGKAGELIAQIVKDASR